MTRPINKSATASDNTKALLVPLREERVLTRYMTQALPTIPKKATRKDKMSYHCSELVDLGNEGLVVVPLSNIFTSV
jgi:hypothetical protein